MEKDTKYFIGVVIILVIAMFVSNVSVTGQPWYTKSGCKTNADCGTSGWIGTPLCSGNNVMQAYRTAVCVKGTLSNKCKVTTSTRVKGTCPANMRCSNGNCVPKCDYDDVCEKGEDGTCSDCQFAQGWFCDHDGQCESGEPSRECDDCAILIEKNFGVLKFISSSVLRDNCELMELEGKEDPHTCDSYRANYDIEGLGLGSVEAIVEVRDTEPINKENIVNAIATYLINNEGMSLHIEGVGGQKVYTLEKSIGVKRDAAVLWASGNKIIAISVDDWDTTLIDDDIFEDLLDAYLAKYPSDFKV